MSFFKNKHPLAHLYAWYLSRRPPSHPSFRGARSSSSANAEKETRLSKTANASLIAARPTGLWPTLAGMITHPLQSIVPPWSWKAAVFTAVLRGLTFFATNIRSGERVAFRAMLVEGAYAVFAAGLAGAISQQLRKTEPLAATLAVVLVALPGFFVFGQLAVHKAAHTPHLAGGLLASFFLTSLSSGFSWYAMRNGAMLGGVDDTTVLHDLHALPRISIGFLLAIPRLLLRTYRGV